MSRKSPPAYCRGCRHLSSDGACIYILNTGVSRPRTEDGVCLARDRGPKDKRMLALPPKREGAERRTIGRVRRAWAVEALSENRAAIDLYDAGGHDHEIARLAGCSITTVAKWRRATGRPANPRKRKENYHGNQSDDPGRGPGR